MILLMECLVYKVSVNIYKGLLQPLLFGSKLFSALKGNQCSLTPFSTCDTYTSERINEDRQTSDTIFIEGDTSIYDSVRSDYIGAMENGKTSETQSINKDVGETVCNPSEIEESSSKKLKNKYLPPCDICGLTASGFHYGVNSCEACKGFFRRCLKKEHLVKHCVCSNGRRGESKRKRQFGCSACRWKLCIEAGMSKEAIKVGRYTLVRRTDNIRKLKDSESQLVSPEPSNNVTCDLATPSPSHEYATCTGSSITVAEMQDIVNVLTEKHLALQKMVLERDPFHSSAQDVILRYQEEYARDYLKRKANGETVSKKKDISAFKKELLKHIESTIADIVRFAKTIPGFCSLTLDDQIHLLKASRTETCIFFEYKEIIRRINTDLEVATSPWGESYHFDELVSLMPKEVYISRKHLASKIDSMSLRDEEVAILKGIIITFTDRTRLKEEEKVAEIQGKLLACLSYLFNNRLGKQNTMLYKTFDLFTAFRNLSERLDTMLKTDSLEQPEFSGFKLLKEVFT